MLTLPLAPEEHWRSGCAYGLDTAVAELGFILEMNVQLFIPHAAHNGTLVSQRARNAEAVIRCSKFMTVSDCYRLRNQWMVDGAPKHPSTKVARTVDGLVAFVWSPEFYRSGEWMTLNIARRLGVGIHKFVIPEKPRL